jgi:hypothetical protein
VIVWCVCVCVCGVRVSYVCALTAGAMANDATPNTVTLNPPTSLSHAESETRD